MKQRKSITLMLYIEMFLFILLSVGPISQPIKMILYGLLVIVVILFRKDGNKMLLGKYQLLLFFSMLIPIILDIRNVDSDNSFSFASFAFFIPFIACSFFVFDYKQFISIYEKTALFLCFISLVGFVLTIYAPNLISKLPTMYFYDRKLYSSVIFNAMNDWTGVGLLRRNCGCAFEPGAFQLVGNLGLAIALKNISKNNIFLSLFKIMVFSLSVVSTVSSTGIVILAFLFLINLFRGKKNFFLILFIIIVLGGVFAASYGRQLEKMETGNFARRFENTIFVFNNYRYQFFGIGSTGYNAIYSTNTMIGSWDTYSNLFLRFGYPFLFLLLLGLFKIIKLDFGIFIVVFLTLFTETIIGPITILFIYYSFSLKNNQKRSEYNESSLGLQCSESTSL